LEVQTRESHGLSGAERRRSERRGRKGARDVPLSSLAPPDRSLRDLNEKPAGRDLRHLPDDDLVLGFSPYFGRSWNVPERGGNDLSTGEQTDSEPMEIGVIHGVGRFDPNENGSPVWDERVGSPKECPGRTLAVRRPGRAEQTL
jgi:hypothetical protein